jgi:hypothetical protein
MISFGGLNAKPCGVQVERSIAIVNAKSVVALLSAPKIMVVMKFPIDKTGRIFDMKELRRKALILAHHSL